MTTRPDHHEPLDAEERDLAARLGRVGPFDGPSPTLDAKILAAAHAAAATRAPNRRRHFAWLGIPPALVTGVGVAAAAVLALGLVWQMRPQYGQVAAHDEAGAGEDEVILIAPPDTAGAPAANPPPIPESSAASAPAKRAAVAAPMRDSAPAPASAKATAPDPAAVAAAEAAASAEAEAQARMLAARADSAREEKRAAEEAANDRFVAEPPAAATAMRKNHATYTTSARASAERRGRAGASAPLAEAPPAPAPVAAPAPAAAASEPESDAPALDRVEVSGSRMRNAAAALSEIPVVEDSLLPADEWLQRIRARRDDGDLERARASLTLFRREHPRIRLPADLRTLLAAPKQ